MFIKSNLDIFGNKYRWKVVLSILGFEFGIWIRLAVLISWQAWNHKKKEGNEGHFGKMSPELKLASFSFTCTPDPPSPIVFLFALHLLHLLCVHTCCLKIPKLHQFSLYPTCISRVRASARTLQANAANFGHEQSTIIAVVVRSGEGLERRTCAQKSAMQSRF